MSKVGWEARIGALAFMAGLSWVGLQAAGVANAEAGDPGAASASAGPARHSASAPRAATSQRKGHTATRPKQVSGSVIHVRSVSVVASPRRVVNPPAAQVAPIEVTAAAPMARPVAAANPIQDFVDHVSLLIRRTFFNQAPTVSPMQITGEHDGVITGTIGAVDPEGDPIKYTVLPAGRPDVISGPYVGPDYGEVVVAADGTFTYTPDADFTGTDDFRVIATDTGFHINLFNLARPAGTKALVEVNQYAIGTPSLRFSFTYDDDSESWWTPTAKAALEAAAQRLASYIVPSSPHPVTVTYYITADTSPGPGILAYSSSVVVGTDYSTDAAFDVFNPTVVQHKILTGVDQNGPSFDGSITFDTEDPWSFGAEGRPYDFEAVAVHELVHTLGFATTLKPAGSFPDGSGRETFDSFIVTSSGVHPIDSDGGWDSTYDANLTGGNGGLYFGGPHAVAAFGGLVQLYTPSSFHEGNSGSHLSGSTTGLENLVMSVPYFTHPRTLSAVELGILEDLGYTIAV